MDTHVQNLLQLATRADQSKLDALLTSEKYVGNQDLIKTLVQAVKKQPGLFTTGASLIGAGIIAKLFLAYLAKKSSNAPQEEIISASAMWTLDTVITIGIKVSAALDHRQTTQHLFNLSAESQVFNKYKNMLQTANPMEFHPDYPLFSYDLIRNMYLHHDFNPISERVFEQANYNISGHSYEKTKFTSDVQRNAWKAWENFMAVIASDEEMIIFSGHLIFGTVATWQQQHKSGPVKNEPLPSVFGRTNDDKQVAAIKRSPDVRILLEDDDAVNLDFQSDNRSLLYHLIDQLQLQTTHRHFILLSLHLFLLFDVYQEMNKLTPANDLPVEDFFKFLWVRHRMSNSMPLFFETVYSASIVQFHHQACSLLLHPIIAPLKRLAIAINQWGEVEYQKYLQSNDQQRMKDIKENIIDAIQVNRDDAFSTFLEGLLGIARGNGTQALLATILTTAKNEIRSLAPRTKKEGFLSFLSARTHTKIKQPIIITDNKDQPSRDLSVRLQKDFLINQAAAIENLVEKTNSSKLSIDKKIDLLSRAISVTDVIFASDTTKEPDLPTIGKRLADSIQELTPWKWQSEFFQSIAWHEQYVTAIRSSYHSHLLVFVIAVSLLLVTNQFFLQPADMKYDHVCVVPRQQIFENWKIALGKLCRTPELSVSGELPQFLSQYEKVVSEKKNTFSELEKLCELSAKVVEYLKLENLREVFALQLKFESNQHLHSDSRPVMSKWSADDEKKARVSSTSLEEQQIDLQLFLQASIAKQYNVDAITREDFVTFYTDEHYFASRAGIRVLAEQFEYVYQRRSELDQLFVDQEIKPRLDKCKSDTLAVMRIIQFAESQWPDGYFEITNELLIGLLRGMGAGLLTYYKKTADSIDFVSRPNNNGSPSQTVTFHVAGGIITRDGNVIDVNLYSAMVEFLQACQEIGVVVIGEDEKQATEKKVEDIQDLKKLLKGRFITNHENIGERKLPHDKKPTVTKVRSKSQPLSGLYARTIQLIELCNLRPVSCSVPKTVVTKSEEKFKLLANFIQNEVKSLLVSVQVDDWWQGQNFPCANSSAVDSPAESVLDDTFKEIDFGKGKTQFLHLSTIQEQLRIITQYIEQVN